MPFHYLPLCSPPDHLSHSSHSLWLFVQDQWVFCLAPGFRLSGCGQWLYHVVSAFQWGENFSQTWGSFIEYENRRNCRGHLVLLPLRTDGEIEVHCTDPSRATQLGASWAGMQGIPIPNPVCGPLSHTPTWERVHLIYNLRFMISIVSFSWL